MVGLENSSVIFRGSRNSKQRVSRVLVKDGINYVLARLTNTQPEDETAHVVRAGGKETEKMFI